MCVCIYALRHMCICAPWRAMSFCSLGTTHFNTVSHLSQPYANYCHLRNGNNFIIKNFHEKTTHFYSKMGKSKKSQPHCKNWRQLLSFSAFIKMLSLVIGFFRSLPYLSSGIHTFIMEFSLCGIKTYIFIKKWKQYGIFHLTKKLKFCAFKL